MKPLVIVYLASPRSWSHLKWTRLQCLAASLQLVVRHLPPLPVIVFHEDYTPLEMDLIQKVNPCVSFERVDFSGHEQDFISTRPGERVGSYGYAMMCQFWGGWVQQHSALQEYSHYLRLDDDAYIVKRVPGEVIIDILGSDYTYRDHYQDANGQSILDFTADFLFYRGFKGCFIQSTSLPYNNFHASALRLWNHALVKEYIDECEKAKGCLQKGWHDTHIHSMIIRFLCPLIGATVRIEPEFSYRHNQQCCHTGPHTEHCLEGKSLEERWGPPDFLPLRL